MLAAATASVAQQSRSSTAAQERPTSFATNTRSSRSQIRIVASACSNNSTITSNNNSSSTTRRQLQLHIHHHHQSTRWCTVYHSKPSYSCDLLGPGARSQLVCAVAGSSEGSLEPQPPPDKQQSSQQKDDAQPPRLPGASSPKQQQQEERLPKGQAAVTPLSYSDTPQGVVPVSGGQQQQQTQLQLAAGQFREQMKALLQQQQQLQQALDASASVQASRSSSNSGKKRSKLRAAAAGSTDLLLSLLQSQLPVLTGRQPPLVDMPAANTERDPQQQQQQQKQEGAAVSAAQQNFEQSQQQRQQQQQRHRSWQQGRKQQHRSGAPAHIPLLAEALNTISWHCRRQQLLPAEASRLQGFMLGQLLPALAPHAHLVNKRQLARVVYALGSCYARNWQQQQQQGEDEDEQSEEQQQQRQQEAAAESSPSRVVTSSSVATQAAARAASSSSSSAAAAAAASAAWVERLLPLLPPDSLTAGGLLAVWQGCALHEVCPPDTWLQQACWVMHAHLTRGKLDFNDTAGLLQACAALDFRPPGWLMVPLVSALQQQLGLLTPADLAGVLTSLQDLSYRPSDTWLRIWCEVSSKHMRGMAVDQLAAAAGAMAWTSYSPKPWWGRRLLAAALPLLPVATADELLLLLHSLLSLRVAADPGWVHEAYCHLAQQQQQLGLSQLADAAHVLGSSSSSLPPNVVRVHRVWLAACLQRVGGWQGGAAAAALSRSELLYMLYAAARLRVSPGDTLLSAALHRLHAELPTASPAELAGCLSVFCYWWKQQQPQQPQHRSSSDAASSTARDSGPGREGSSSSSSIQQHGEKRAAAGAGVIGLVELQACLSAVVSCKTKFSDEGLLQLLLTCAGLPLEQVLLQHQQQQDDVDDAEQQQQQVIEDMQGSICVLTDALIARLPQMGLVQLSRMSRTLETRSSGSGSGSSSSSSSIGGGVSASTRRPPPWYEELSQAVKAAMAARA